MAQTDTKIRVSLIDGVTRSLTEIQRGVTGLGASIAKVNQAAELTGRAFGVLGSALGSITGAVESVGGLEDAMVRVATQTRATADEQKVLSEAIRQALTDTRFGADEAGAALLTLAKDGQNATESAQNLGVVLAYAQANAQGATQAAQGLGDVLDSFGAPAEQIGALADALTATAQAAGTSTETLQQGLAGVGLEAQAAGLSLNDTLAILGQLAKNGLEGSAAAASLNKALTSLSNPSASLSSVFDELNLTGKSVSEILTALQGDSAAAEKVLSELGDRPRRALRLLVQEGGGDLKKFAEAIDSSAGSSQKAAEALNTTFLGSLQRIQNQLTLLKNDVLAPILKPLADEFDSFANQLREFSQSEAFAKLVEDIRLFASEGIKAVGDFVRDFDFAEALESAQNFVAESKAEFNSLAESLKIVAGAIGTVYDVVKGGAAVVVESFAGVANDLAEIATKFGVPAEELAVMFDDIAKGARGLSDEALLSLQRRFGLTAEQATRLTREVQATATAARAARADLRALAEALPANDVGAIAARWKEFGAAVREIPPAAKIAADELFKIKVSADEAAIGLERLRLATLTEAVARLAAANLQNTDTFRALVAEVGKAEERIRQLQKQLQDAGDETDKMGDSADKAGQQLQNLADNTDELADSTQKLTNRNSQVRESFGNIGAAASSVAVDMGNLSEEYIRQSLAAAGASKSIRGYIDTLNRQMEAGIEQQRQVADRLAQQERLNRSLDEEAQALDRLRQQYPAIAEGELKKLYDAQKRYTELLERQNKTKREGLDLDQQTAVNAANTAGGFGPSPRTPAPAPAPTGTQPASTPSAGSITVNVSGFVTQDALQQVVDRIRRAGLLAR